MPADGSGLCDGGAVGGDETRREKHETKGVAVWSSSSSYYEPREYYYYGLRHGMGADMEGTM